MSRFSITDIITDISFQNNITINDLNCFSNEYSYEPELKIDIRFCEDIKEPKGQILIDQELKWIKSTCGDYDYAIYIKPADKTVCSLLSRDKWRQVTLSYLNNDIKPKDVIFGPLLQIVFNNFILSYNGIIVHAAGIEWNSKGIIFAAPSGTGKTTQANLWKKYMGAKIVNGDRPALRIVDDEVFLYGTPWSGSSNDFLNIKVPLNAIVILEQSEENEIRKLSINEAVLYLLPRCMFPYQDSELMKNATNTIEFIIFKTPVYLLKCRPDRQAVELVYQCVK